MHIVETPTSEIADELIGRIEILAPELRAQSEDNARLGMLNEPTINLLREADLLRAMAPVEYGGLELSPLDAVRVYDALATVDTSAQWVAMVPGTMTHALRLIDQDAAKEMSQTGVPFIAGQFAPNGRAERTEGGYRVTGKWSYGSGIKHATYAGGGAIITRDGKPELDANGNPQIAVIFTPIENVAVGGNWDVLGLNATGSVDYDLDDVFVPSGYTLTNHLAPVQPGSPRSALPGLTGWLVAFHGAAALGGGRRILDELAAFAKTPSSRGVRLADDQRFKYLFAKAEAQYRSARAYLYEGWVDLQKTVNAGEIPTRDTNTAIRTATLHLHDINVENATFAFRESGGTGLRSGSLQRAYADVMAMGQHIVVSQSTYYECARDFLGEAEGQNWIFYSLA